MRHPRTREQWKRDCAARRAAIVAAARTGESFEAVAKRFGISPAHVYYVCRVAGLAFGPRGEVGAHAERWRARKRIADAGGPKVTAAELAAKFGLDRLEVVRICHEFGVRLKRWTPPSQNRALAERRELAARLDGSGGCRLAIARLFEHPRTRALARLLVETELTFQQIAARRKISRQWVLQIWERLKKRATLTAPPTPAPAPPR